MTLEYSAVALCFPGVVLVLLWYCLCVVVSCSFSVFMVLSWCCHLSIHYHGSILIDYYRNSGLYNVQVLKYSNIYLREAVMEETIWPMSLLRLV